MHATIESSAGQAATLSYNRSVREVDEAFQSADLGRPRLLRILTLGLQTVLGYTNC